MSLIQDIQITDRLAQAAGLPREAILDISPPSMPASHRVVALQPTTTNSVGPSQTLQWQLPQRNLMRSHSAYLKFKFAPSTTSTWSFAGTSQTCASLINSIQLQAGGVVVENLLNYDKFHNNIIQAWAETDEAMAVENICNGSLGRGAISGGSYAALSISGTGATGGYNYAASNFATSATTPEYVFTMPLYLGAFNNKNSTLIPLQFIQGGMLLTIQTNPVSKAFYSGDAAQPSTYTISEAQIYYDEITPTNEYISTVQQGLSQGKLIKIEAESYINVQIGASSTIRQQVSLNMSSLDAVLWGYVKGADVQNSSKFFISPSTTYNDWSNTTRFEVYLDNALVFNSSIQLSFPSIQVRELQKALSSSVIGDHSSPIINGLGGDNTSPGRYLSQGNLKGINTKNFISDDVSMAGTKVSQAQIQFTDTNTSSLDTYYVYFLHSYIMLIDASMSVSKVM
jgi:hypothetical protein